MSVGGMSQCSMQHASLLFSNRSALIFSLLYSPPRQLPDGATQRLHLYASLPLIARRIALPTSVNDTWPRCQSSSGRQPRTPCHASPL